MVKHKKRKAFSFLAYFLIGILVTGITVGVILVQEGTNIFSFAQSPFGVSVQPGWTWPQVTLRPGRNLQLTSPVTQSGECGWCGFNCVPREQILKTRCTKGMPDMAEFRCVAVRENGQTVCRVRRDDVAP